MARKSNITVISKIIAYALIIIIIACLIGFLSYYTNGFTSGFSTFYVEYNTEIYNGTHTGLELNPKGQSRFDIKYPLSFLSKNELKGYTIKIIPNADKDFEFRVNGMDYSFNSEKDLTSGFDIEYDEGYFLISNNFTPASVLKKIYSGKNVEVPEPTNVDYFRMIITSYNGESVVNISFHRYVAVEGIELHPGGITV